MPLFRESGRFVIEKWTADGTGTAKTFSAIPGTFDELLIVAHIVSGQAAAAAGVDVTVNGDTGANYNYQTVVGASTAASAAATAAGNAWALTVPAATSTMKAGVIVMRFPDYATGLVKTAKVNGGYAVSAAANGMGTYEGMAVWNSTAAISSLTFTCVTSIASGSVIRLYGIK
jgi:hypothetical protein